MAHANEDLARKGYEAFMKADMQEVSNFFAENIVSIEEDRRGGGLILPPGVERVAAVVLIPRDGGHALEGRLPAPAG